jgi:hypothetical protein
MIKGHTKIELFNAKTGELERKMRRTTSLRTPCRS